MMENNKTIIIRSWNEIKPILNESSVPRIFWCYWAGGPMNGNRLRSLDMMQKYMEVPICMITESNLKEFILEDYPLHKVFNHLSSVHQSDYLRIYLLHHYGGGWCDIKPTEISYLSAWNEFDNPDIYLVGKPEIKKGPAKVFDQNGLWMPKYWRYLVATNRWIGRKNTPLSKELYDAINRLLDENIENLKKNPAKHAHDKKRKRLFPWLYVNKNQYPLPYTVFGNLFHPLNYKYRQHIKQILPFDEIKNLGLDYR